MDEVVCVREADDEESSEPHLDGGDEEPGSEEPGHGGEAEGAEGAPDGLEPVDVPASQLVHGGDAEREYQVSDPDSDDDGRHGGSTEEPGAGDGAGDEDRTGDLDDPGDGEGPVREPTGQIDETLKAEAEGQVEPAESRDQTGPLMGAGHIQDVGDPERAEVQRGGWVIRSGACCLGEGHGSWAAVGRLGHGSRGDRV